MKLSHMLLIGCLLYLCQGESTAYLPHDLEVIWSFSAVDMVAEFGLYVPDAIKAEFKWVGIGIKDTAKGTSMRESDIVVIHFCDEYFEDRYAEENGEPLIDVVEGGTDDLQSTKFEKLDDGYSLYTWKRNFVTGDIDYDQELILNADYYLLWAFGMLDDDGVSLKRHKTDNRGSVEIIFQDGFIYEEEEEDEALLVNASV